MDYSEETNCQAREGPILCVNNCGFFGSAATMNMCSKCHKGMILDQEQAKIAMSSINDIINEGSCSNAGSNNSLVFAAPAELPAPAETKVVVAVPTEVKSFSFEGQKRCTACRKRVGLTGFNCRCGNLFCASHRYSDKHDCQFDYQTAGRDAIARANPVVKAEKLDKI